MDNSLRNYLPELYYMNLESADYAPHYAGPHHDSHDMDEHHHFHQSNDMVPNATGDHRHHHRSSRDHQNPTGIYDYADDKGEEVDFDGRSITSKDYKRSQKHRKPQGEVLHGEDLESNYGYGGSGGRGDNYYDFHSMGGQGSPIDDQRHFSWDFSKMDQNISKIMSDEKKGQGYSSRHKNDDRNSGRNSGRNGKNAARDSKHHSSKHSNRKSSHRNGIDLGYGDEEFMFQSYAHHPTVAHTAYDHNEIANDSWDHYDGYQSRDEDVIHDPHWTWGGDHADDEHHSSDYSAYEHHRDQQHHYLVLEESANGEAADEWEQNQVQQLLDKTMKMLESEIQADQKALYMLEDMPYVSLAQIDNASQETNDFKRYDLTQVDRYVEGAHALDVEHETQGQHLSNDDNEADQTLFDRAQEAARKAADDAKTAAKKAGDRIEDAEKKAGDRFDDAKDWAADEASDLEKSAKKAERKAKRAVEEAKEKADLSLEDTEQQGVMDKLKDRLSGGAFDNMSVAVFTTSACMLAALV